MSDDFRHGSSYRPKSSPKAITDMGVDEQSLCTDRIRTTYVSEHTSDTRVLCVRHLRWLLPDDHARRVWVRRFKGYDFMLTRPWHIMRFVQMNLTANASRHRPDRSWWSAAPGRLPVCSQTLTYSFREHWMGRNLLPESSYKKRTSNFVSVRCVLWKGSIFVCGVKC